MKRSPASRVRSMTLDLRLSGWDPFLLACVAHSTIPTPSSESSLISVDAFPLEGARELGERDRLSLLAQYTAHLSLLRFIGREESAFRQEDWIVTQRRGEDPRLIRITGPSTSSEVGGVLNLIEEFAKLIHAPTPAALDATWARADSIYIEIDRMLRSAPNRARWERAAAVGQVYSPGIEALRDLTERPSLHVNASVSVIDRLRILGALGIAVDVVPFGFGSPSPLQPFSALSSPCAADAIPSDVAEKIAQSRGDRVALVVTRSERFDAKSRLVLKLLPALIPHASWIHAGSSEADTAFSVSGKLRYAETFRAHVAAGSLELAALQRFAQSVDFDRFLDDGIVPASATPADAIAEPRRSCLAAIAVLGENLATIDATRFLERLGVEISVDELAAHGVVVTADRIVFEDKALHRALISSLDDAMRHSLVTIGGDVVAASADTPLLAHFYTEHGQPDDALQRISAVAQLDIETLRALAGLPPSQLADFPSLASRVARVLYEEGQYVDALHVVRSVSEPDARVIAASCERRRGNYAAALELLGALPDIGAVTLRAELHRLTGNIVEAAEVLRTVERSSLDEEALRRLEYEEEMLAIDDSTAPLHQPERFPPYLANRLRTYAALSAGDFESAAVAAEAADASAANVVERIDALLDRLYSAFEAGKWDEARRHARYCLALIEETQGDRAAAGVLFTLSYLCADSGRWREAEEGVRRLEEFYRRASDRRRLDEIDLLRSYLSFSRGELEAALPLAKRVVDSCSNPDIREAAAQILDEAAWMQGGSVKAIARGESNCIEFRSRHQLLAARLKNYRAAAPLPGRFEYRLVEFEKEVMKGGDATLPATPSSADALKLIRSLRGVLSRVENPLLREELARLSAQMGVSTIETPASVDSQAAEELSILQSIAVIDFPFDDKAFGGDWEFASRNRLGRWSAIGTITRGADYDERLSHCNGDWLAIGESALLRVKDSNRWSAATRTAVAELALRKWELHRLRRLNEEETNAAPPPRVTASSGILGESRAIVELMQRLELISSRDMPVVILGESGVGKELIARAIHRCSPRKREEFTAVNCAALPDNLVESELFGHAKGAFTGADRDRAGLIEATNRGTLFLDEIGELPLPAQAKLLRFLQEKEIRRVGETTVRTADVRIVAATHRKLEAWVDEGRFREDLYYRIKGVELEVPPLRERGNDILLLANDFLARERAEHRQGPDRFTDAVESVLLSYSWPGNVRELQHTIRAAHVLAGEARAIDLQHLPERIRNVAVVRSASGTYYEEVLRFRRKLIEQSLLQAKGNQNHAAKLLGISRQVLAYQIRELGVLIRKA